MLLVEDSIIESMVFGVAIFSRDASLHFSYLHNLDITQLKDAYMRCNAS